jgi:hypothetical protein
MKSNHVDLSKFAEGDEVIEHYMFHAFTDYLARYQKCLRPLNENEKKEIGNDIFVSQTSASVLGEKYYFDPLLDKDLDKKLQAAVDFIKASQTLRGAFIDNKKDNNPAEPFMLSSEFLRMAASQTTDSLNAQIIRTYGNSMLSQQLDNKVHTDNEGNVSDKSTRQNEVLKKFDDGWSLVRYHDYDEFYEQYKKLSFCLSTKVNRSRLESGSHSYCAMLNGDNEPTAFMMFVNNEGVFELSHLKSKGGELPKNEIIDRLVPYLDENKIPIRGTENTGVLVANNTYHNVFKLPDHLTAVNSDISISGDAREFSLNKLQRARSISITNCENFASLGSLTRVDKGIELNGCSNLNSLAGLVSIGGSLSIKETNIQDIPDSLKRVGGFIRTDFGTYETIFFSKFRLRREFPGKRSKGLPYMGPTPW